VLNPVQTLKSPMPFRFNGKLAKVTINLKPVPMNAEDQKRWNEEARRVNLAAE